MTDLLQALIDKLCGGSYVLAVHYASCDECTVHGVAMDWTCEAGERLEDHAWRPKPDDTAEIVAVPLLGVPKYEWPNLPGDTIRYVWTFTACPFDEETT